ncbi:hypothetical protein FA95DRAFT_710773 [Auriscalpium vulgare]|uniref:Uncharacterized protein n=1 Tax=Auriscalpium vulgare TaxID=40419 RepID=A0ACB8RB66_9AGAM|nr:hypothetical protein FA95DRAFT_710773 [Auriscalpium vulgare]
MGRPRRMLMAQLTGVACVLFIASTLYLSSGTSSHLRDAFSGFSASLFSSSPQPLSGVCSPDAWSNGQWTRRPEDLTDATSHDTAEIKGPEDAMRLGGFEGCASSREVWWHMAVDRMPDYNPYPNVTRYDWTPASKGCATGVRPLDGAELVRELVEDGGWFLIGDSITENHFFSLSCVLYPHVRATPIYDAHSSFDRAWPQNLYLNPASPLISSLSLPPGFSIEQTPLVTFRRIDLLLSQADLRDLHRAHHPDTYAQNASFDLFSDEPTWSMSPSEYMPMFLAPLPEARYSTLIASTAGHWTTTLFAGYHNSSEEEVGHGVKALLPFFGEAMDSWAGDVQAALDEEKRRAARAASASVYAKDDGNYEEVAAEPQRQVVVRAYLPGHEDCHQEKSPWTEWKPYVYGWFNWPWIGDMNDIIKNLVRDKSAFPDIHFLGIDRPALLRPDAHASGDCLHLVTGSGVIEGWTRYVWHFISRELGPTYT